MIERFKRVSHLAAISLMGLAAAFSPAAAQAPATQPADLAVRRAVAHLGDVDFAVREKASQQLWEMGPAAETELKRAVDSADPEIAARAGEILADIRCGVWPDSPPATIQAVRDYRAGSDAEKRVAIAAMLSEGDYAHLARLWQYETDPARKRRLLDELGQHPVESARSFIALGVDQEADRLLRHPQPQVAAALAAWELSRGQLEPAIAVERTRVDQPAHALVLAYLLRARGDFAEAFETAERAGNEELADAVLLDQKNYAALAQRIARRPDVNDSGDDLQRLAYLQQLAGDDDASRRTIDRLAKNEAIRKRSNAWPAAKAMLLTGDGTGAMELLKQADMPLTSAVLLNAHQRYAEAIDIARTSIKNNHRDALALKLLLARLYHQTGDRAAIQQLSADMVRSARGQRNAEIWRQVLTTLAEVGESQRAKSQLIIATQQLPVVAEHLRLVGATWPDHDEEAQAWWLYFHEMGPKSDTMRDIADRVAEVVEGRTPVEDLVEIAAATARSQSNPDIVRGMLQTLRWRGQEELARTLQQNLAERTHLAEDLLAVADDAAERGEWALAQRYYGRANAAEPDSEAVVYRLGHAMAQLENPQGELLMQRARCMPLNDAVRRLLLVQVMIECGHADAAREQLHIVQRTYEPWNSRGGHALEYAARNAYARRDWATAADLWTHVMLMLPDMSNIRANLSMSAIIRHTRALALLDAGQNEQAAEQITQARRLLPGDIELPIRLCGPLQQAGMRQLSEELFGEALAINRELVEKYPQSASLHNTVAWLLVRCRRNLDVALEHAETGVALDPRNVAIIDTLAEVYFQLGDRHKAMETILRCIEIEPQFPRHREALKRFEQLTPDTDPPPE